MNNPFYGEGYIPAYQMSASPFVTSSQILDGEIQEIHFGNVSRFFTVKNTGVLGSSGTLAVAFTENGFKQENLNFFFLLPSESFGAEIRTDRLFISGASGTSIYSVVAGLTCIQPRDFLVITSSNGFNGVG